MNSDSLKVLCVFIFPRFRTAKIYQLLLKTLRVTQPVGATGASSRSLSALVWRLPVKTGGECYRAEEGRVS